jgi:NitT/TauT family transport system ATP-binding protein
MRDLILQDLSKSYGSRRVLEHFSAVFPAGETTCILGPSGCGKTTLLRLILNLEQPDAGQILDRPPAASAVFQENRLFEAFTTLSNAAAVLAGSRRERHAAAQAVLTELGLGDSLHLPVTALSGGMKRRVAIARALLVPTELLVLDEPFTGLDAATKAEVLQCIRRRSRGITTLLVTHDPGEAQLLGAGTLSLPSL